MSILQLIPIIFTHVKESDDVDDTLLHPINEEIVMMRECDDAIILCPKVCVTAERRSLRQA